MLNKRSRHHRQGEPHRALDVRAHGAALTASRRTASNGPTERVGVMVSIRRSAFAKVTHLPLGASLYNFRKQWLIHRRGLGHSFSLNENRLNKVEAVFIAPHPHGCPAETEHPRRPRGFKVNTLHQR